MSIPSDFHRAIDRLDLTKPMVRLDNSDKGETEISEPTLGEQVGER